MPATDDSEYEQYGGIMVAVMNVDRSHESLYCGYCPRARALVQVRGVVRNLIR
jgi:hypothetical protein